MKRKFPVTVTCFKPSGKYYSAETVWVPLTDCNSKPDANNVLAPPSAYMPDAVDWLHAQATVPGLTSATWAGPILLTCEDGYPVLILEGKA